MSKGTHRIDFVIETADNMDGFMFRKLNGLDDIIITTGNTYSYNVDMNINQAELKILNESIVPGQPVKLQGRLTTSTGHYLIGGIATYVLVQVTVYKPDGTLELLQQPFMILFP
jgi:hypothetical protein